jgi:KDO2-lipid IV(A) lauroyltransferase
MKRIFQKISFYFFKLLRALLLRLSENSKVNIGKVFGILMMFVSAKRRRITYDNIEKVSSLKGRDIDRIAKASYQNLGITLIELLTIDKYDYKRAEPKVAFSNIELISSVQSRGNGVILLSGHYGNWELLAYSAGVLLEKTINIIIKYQMNPFTDRYLRNLRQRGGNRLIDMHKAGSSIIKVLKGNGIIAMLADQRAGKNEGIILDFLGRQARVYSSPAKLALRLQAPIIVGYPVRDEKNNYQIELKEIIHSDLENNEEGIHVLTKRYLETLEEAIDRNPELWAWQHNRWKIN